MRSFFLVTAAALVACGGASTSGAKSANQKGDQGSGESIADLASREGIASLDGDKSQATSSGSGSLRLDLSDKDNPINVDGVPKEWTLVPALTGAANGISFKCGLAYDARNVYVAGDVTGVALRHLRRFTADEDHATLVLVAPGGAPTEVSFFAGKPGDVTGVVRMHGRNVPGAKIVEAEKDNGYTFEAAVPWSALAPPTVHVGLRGVVQFHAPGAAGILATGNGDASSPRELAALPTAPEQALAEMFLGPKNLLGAAPKYEILADVAGDAMKERVAVYDKFLTVVGPGYREGKEFFYRDLGAEIIGVDARDITGRGKQDLIIRRRFSGSPTREWLDVFSFFADEATSVFSHEISVSSGDKHATNAVHLGRGSIDVTYDPAAGWDASSYAEPTASDTEPLILPWGQVKSQTFRFDGKTFVKAKEVAQAGQPRASTTTVATKTTTATTPSIARVEPQTPSMRPGGDLSEQLLSRYRTDRGVSSSLRPKVDVQVQVDGDARPERVLLLGRDIVVFGPGFKGGTSYAYLTLSQFADAADIDEMTLRDLTGDGAADLVVRGVRHVNAQIPGGGAHTIDMHVMFVYQLRNEAITRVFGIETARTLGNKRVQGLVQLVPGHGNKGFDVDVHPGRAQGWTDKTYPFTQDQPGSGALEPLLLPWGGIDHLRYAFDGTAFARVP